MKIANVIADLRVIWLRPDGSIGFKIFKPPFKLPIPVKHQPFPAKELKHQSFPVTEHLPGYYAIGTDGSLLKIEDNNDISFPYRRKK